MARLGRSLGSVRYIRQPPAVKPGSAAAPVASGAVNVGSTDSTTNGVWGGVPTPASYTYQWQDSPDGSTGWANITGATSSTYVIASGEATKYLRCVVTASNASGSASANSNVLGPVTSGTTFTITLTSSDATAATLVKLVAKAVPVAEPTSVSLVKAVSVTRVATQAQAATFARLVSKTLSAAQAQSASFQRFVSKTVAVTQAQVVSAARFVSKTLSDTQAQLATLTTHKGGTVFLTVTATVVSAPVMWFRRGLSISAATINSLATAAAQIIQLIISPDEHA